MEKELTCWTRMGEYKFFVEKGVDTPFTVLLGEKASPFTPVFLKRNDKRDVEVKTSHVYYADYSRHTMNPPRIDHVSDRWVAQEAITTPGPFPCDIKLIYHNTMGVVFSYAKFNEDENNKIVYRQRGAKYIRIFPELRGLLTDNAKEALDAMRIDRSNIRIPSSLMDIVETIGPEYYSMLQEQCETFFHGEFGSQEISFDFKYGHSDSKAIDENAVPLLHSSSDLKWYALEINSNPDCLDKRIFKQSQHYEENLLSRIFSFINRY